MWPLIGGSHLPQSITFWKGSLNLDVGPCRVATEHFANTRWFKPYRWSVVLAMTLQMCSEPDCSRTSRKQRNHFVSSGVLPCPQQGINSLRNIPDGGCNSLQTNAMLEDMSLNCLLLFLSEQKCRDCLAKASGKSWSSTCSVWTLGSAVRGPFLPAWHPCHSPQLLPLRWWCWSPQATKSWRGRGVWETSFMPLMVVFVVYSLSHDQLFVTPWILSPWDFPDKNTGMGWHFLHQGIFPNRDQTHVSCIARKILYHWAPGKANATGASLQIFFFF